MCATVPRAASENCWVIERPCAPNHELGMLVVNGLQTRHTRWGASNPSAGGCQLFRFGWPKVYSHPRCHIIACTRE
jgi:hypothetical protein